MKNMSDHLMLDRLKLLKIRTVDNLRFSRTSFIENRGLIVGELNSRES